LGLSCEAKANCLVDGNQELLSQLFVALVLRKVQLVKAAEEEKKEKERKRKEKEKESQFFFFL